MAHRCLLGVALGFAALTADPAGAADATPKPVVLPPGNRVELMVGGSRRFSASMASQDVEYRWTVDGAPAGSDRTFEYAPESGDIGIHEIAVTVLQGPAATRHVWRVTVDPPPVPKVADVAPAAAVVRARPGERVTFRYLVTSSVATDEVDVIWTVDGTPTGSGTSFTLAVEAGDAKRVRAVASSTFGAVQAREWRLVPEGPAMAEAPPPGEVEPDEELVALLRTMKPERQAPDTVPPARVRETTTTVRVAPATTTSTAPARATATAPVVATTSTAAVASTTSTVSVARPVTTTEVRVAPTTSTIAVASVVPTTIPRPVPPPPARPAAPPSTVLAAIPPAPTPPPVETPARAGIPREEIVAFLDRYARAYESRSVGELRRIGQVTSTEQAEALGRYFEQVRDLRVEVRVLEIESRGAGARVRYRRRDRFRDPTGRLVDKETPPIEKEIRRSPDGLVFTPSS